MQNQQPQNNTPNLNQGAYDMQQDMQNNINNMNNNEYPNFFSRDYHMHLNLIKTEKRTIRKLGNITGLALLGYVVLSNIWSIFISLFGLLDYYYDSQTFQTGINIILVIGSILVSFVYFSKHLNRISHQPNPLMLNAPKDKKLFALAIPAGLGICMVANYVTSYIVIMMSMFGIELSSPETVYSTAGFDIFLTFVQVVLVAGFVEEICLRGFVMGNLRQYGMKFAVLASAVVFSIMHGNLIQAPFAFIVGIGLGYLSIQTGSIWTAILIHGINNFISILVTYSYYYVDISVINLVYAVFMYAMIFVGAICLNSINKSTRYARSMQPKNQLLSLSQMCGAFFSAPAMIISLLYLFVQTMAYVSFT